MYELSSLQLWDDGSDPEAVSSLTTNLSVLDLQAVSFHAALELIAYSNELVETARTSRGQATDDQTRDNLRERGKTFAEWKMIACRDAAMTVFHFGKALESISFKELPAFREYVDFDLLRKARRQFETDFPEIEKFRNSIAHSGENASKSERPLFDKGIAEPGFTVPAGSSIAMQGTLVGDQITSTAFHPHTKEVLLLSVAVNADALNKLLAIKTMVLQAFLPLQKALRDNMRQALLGKAHS